jgi:hypothetical protein
MTENSGSAGAAEPRAALWASDVAGRVLASLFAAIRMVRGPRPIHPRGEIFGGHVEWVNPTGKKSGIPWIDVPPASGRQDATVRVSRSVGLPPALPDVIGLAFKFETGRGAADLELASSWLGVPGRFLLRPGLTADGVCGSLMPYRGGFGAVEVCARTRGRANDTWTIDLFHATLSSTWTRFAVVNLPTKGMPDNSGLRFDAVVNPLPGAGTYDWTRRLRQRSYIVARRSTTVPGYRTPPG